MNQYAKLADIYDYLMQGVDYDGWADYIGEIFDRFKCRPGRVLDLAWGTGNSSLPLARRGFKVLGLDLAPQMINQARDKAAAAEIPAEFMVADMTDFWLPEPVEAVTCFQDGFNYLLDDEQLEQAFTCVARNLAPGGLVIFDLNNLERLDNGFPQIDYAEEDNLSLICESNFNRQDRIWEITLICFVKRGDMYEKFRETHREKDHDRDNVVRLLHGAGLELLDIFSAFTFDPPQPDSRRLFYVATRAGAKLDII